MEERKVLIDTFAFHGHRCWASTAGVRAGLAALRSLGLARAGAKSLHATVEIGDHHGAMCFADGVQFVTGCTFGKGNIDKTGQGRLALTLVDKTADQKVRVAYRPTLQPRIKESAFMRQRTAGVPADQIPDADQWELVDLLWEAPEGDVLTVEDVVPAAWHEPEEAVRFAVCLGCGELVAEPYLRVVAGEQRCLACSGYPH
jgi:formylmethanofuran dehydrogenase subunit E